MPRPHPLTQIEYAGTELELFAEATNWKNYLRDVIRPHIRGRVLEVGAGLGAMTRMLAADAATWTSLEPDPKLAARLKARTDLARVPRVIVGTLRDLPEQDRFDTIIYVDVLEHIEDDGAELASAAAKLTPQGRLVVLSPAHQALYSPFDKRIGHFRRYSAARLRAITPPVLECRSLRYIDAAGLASSAANRILLHASMPTRAQVLLWDRWLVPVSRVIDRVTAGRVGKSILAVWVKAR